MKFCIVTPCLDAARYIDETIFAYPVFTHTPKM